MIGIVAALDAEARTLRRARRRRNGGASIGAGISVIVGGMGPAAATRAARALADAGATALVSWGVAGGLDPALHPGAIVLPAEILAESGERYPADPQWRECERRALAPHRSVCDGAILSRALPLADALAKDQARRATGAVAVDMESAAIAAVAAARRLPFLAVRTIVDAAGDALPRAVVDASRGDRLRVTRLIAGLLRSPRELAGLVGLARRYRAARRALVFVADVGLAAPP